MPSILTLLRSDDTARASLLEQFNYNGQAHPLVASRAHVTAKEERTARTFATNSNGTGAVWSTTAAAIDARGLLMSQLVFQWLGVTEQNKGRRWGSRSLTLLEDAPGGVPISQILYRVEQDVAHDGNFYLWRNRQTGDVVRLRPDWVDIILDGDGVDANVRGYSYHQNGRNREGAILLDARDVLHFAPEPEPTARYVGRPWITSVWHDIVTDQAAVQHVKQFFNNAATPSMIVEAPPGIDRDTFMAWVARMDEANAGVRHSGKTMYVVNGVGTTPLGSKINELDLSNVTGSVDNRVAVRSRVPAVILGVREAMQGSSLNAGNYGQTRRLWADSWFSPYAQRFCDHLHLLFDPAERPSDGKLTFDPTAVQLLQEDMQDAAAIAQGQAVAIETLHRAGFDPDAAVSAVTSGDMRRLTGQHTGLSSVQLLPPDTGTDGDDSDG